MFERIPPSLDVQRARQLDRAAEQALRNEVRRELDRLLGERQLLALGRDDEARIRTIIGDCVARREHAAAATGAALLMDAAGVEQRLVDGFLGMGVLESLMRDPSCEEVIVNSPDRIFSIEDGVKRLTDLFFEDDAEVRELVKRLLGPLGRRLDESSPMVDARLPGGARLNAAMPPATTKWTVVTIRKFILAANSLDQLVQRGSLSQTAAEFLEAAVQAGLNILVSGPTGSGKTTFLNCLGAAIASPQERLVTIEETPELQLDRLPDCVALQARGTNVEGIGEIRIRDLVRNALRMRPTRIVVGECRGGEALDVLLAMNTGHDGSLTSLHANSPRDAIDRIITLAQMADERLPREALTHMVGHTIDLIVQLRFDPLTSSRRVQSIYEITGLEGDVVTGNELWAMAPSTGRLDWTGIQPRGLERMRAKGVAYTPPAVRGDA
jgi:pilus assembly protein CpaF